MLTQTSQTPMPLDIPSLNDPNDSGFDKLGRLLYCGGVRSTVSMLVFWTSVALLREVYSSVIGEEVIFGEIEEMVFWVVGTVTVILGLVGLYVEENRLRYLCLMLGSFVHIWVAVQIYLSSGGPSSFVPASTAMWFFGAAIYFKGVMNGKRSYTPCSS